jgi:hypothetical protein
MNRGLREPGTAMVMDPDFRQDDGSEAAMDDRHRRL